MQFDTAIVGATLLTGDPSRPVLKEGVLGVAGNRIAFVGAREELPAEIPAARVVEADGRLVTPGFVNVHTHAVLSLMRGIALDMGFAPAYTRGVPHGHDITEDEAVALARLGALESLTFGSTAMVDSYVHAHVTLPAMADLGLRVWSCTRFHDVDFTRVHEGIWRHDLAIGDACIEATRELMKQHHNGRGGRTHVTLAPHAPDTCSDELLAKVAGLARETGLNIWTHLSQSKLENAVIAKRSGGTPTQLLERVGLLTDRLIAAHCIYLTDDDIARLAASGMTVAHVPKGNATGGAMAPTPKLKAAGARIALGTDNLTQDMTEAMRWSLAVARIQIGSVSDQWQPKDAFAMATSAGAQVLGRSHEMGRLMPGYLADFVVFDFRHPHLTPLLDPLGTLVHDAGGRDVEHVFVDGRQVIANGLPTMVDAARIRADAQRAAEALWARAADEKQNSTEQDQATLRKVVGQVLRELG
ncbi:MAG TPA: amidohydrolase family protein [Xanthobacteraceae bacterium]|nr:amidohydrolase family protein [Xanthobacteraceae bacterium]